MSNYHRLITLFTGAELTFQSLVKKASDARALTFKTTNKD